LRPRGFPVGDRKSTSRGRAIVLSHSTKGENEMIEKQKTDAEPAAPEPKPETPAPDVLEPEELAHVERWED
jgi:hypothetical protein